MRSRALRVQIESDVDSVKGKTIMKTSHTLSSNGNRTNPFIVALFWLCVGIPLAWGVSSTMQKAMALFH